MQFRCFISRISPAKSSAPQASSQTELKVPTEDVSAGDTTSAGAVAAGTDIAVSDMTTDSTATNVPVGSASLSFGTGFQTAAAPNDVSPSPTSRGIVAFTRAAERNSIDFGYGILLGIFGLGLAFV